MTNTYTARGPAPADCIRLERELAGFLDGTLDDGRAGWVADHLAACDRCAALLGALDAPSEVGRAVMALPAMTAPAHLWDGVADRIAAPVVAIGPARHTAKTRDAGPRWFRTAAAAAVLVAATAGVTYELTVRRATTGATGATGAAPALVASADPATVAAPRTTPTVPDEPQVMVPAGASATPESSPETATPETATPERAVTNVANRSPRLSAGRRAAAPTDEARATYDREISKLRTVLADRRGVLDTSTVRVLEQNMLVIDRAIAQSKAALARDPASGFLNQQLNNALDRKLELLRTAALLPAST